MKKFLIVAVLIIGAALVGAIMFRKSQEAAVANLTEKLYVAVEGAGKVAVIDPVQKKTVRYIDLSLDHEGHVQMYTPHNIQVAPDGKSVWVTANVAGEDGHSHESFLSPKKVLANGSDEPFDDVIVIDPLTDTIKARISIAPYIHLAHVTVTPDSRFAYITAQEEGAVYKIDALAYFIEKRIETGAGSEPHGLRVSPDGSTAYIAMLKGKALGMLSVGSDTFTSIPLDGQAVQTGVTPDGAFVVASLYDTKKLAVYDVAMKSVRYVDLPAGAKGPVQMYPTPDSRFMYLADQGYYFGQPESNLVYKIDIHAGRVVKEIVAGKAPHGVAISPDGKSIYVTNLLSNDVSVIDTATDTETEKIFVGVEPNGVSYWSK